MWSPEKSTAGMMDGLLLATAHTFFPSLLLWPATFMFKCALLYFFCPSLPSSPSYHFHISFNWSPHIVLPLPLCITSLPFPPHFPKDVMTHSTILGSAFVFSSSFDCPLLAALSSSAKEHCILYCTSLLHTFPSFFLSHYLSYISLYFSNYNHG